MRSLIVACALVSAAVWAQSAPKVALLPAELDHVGREVAGTVDETLASELSKKGLTVVRWSELVTALSSEKASALAACASTTVSCAKELGVTADADRLLLPRVSKYAKGFRLQIAVLDAKTGERLSTPGERARTDSALRDAAVKLAQRISTDVQTGASTPAEAVDEPDSERVRPWPYLAMGGGALLLGSGTYWMLQAKDAHDELVAPSTGAVITPEHRRDLVSRGQLFQTLGWAALGVGAAAIAAGVVSTVDFDTETEVSGFILPTGGGVSARFVFP